MNNKIITPVKERFETKVIQIPFSDCHYWIAGVSADGYGWFGVNSKKPDKAHRVAYRLYVGEIPEGLFVLHSCDNKLCVNPAHLRLGTQSDNMRDLALRYKYKISLDSAKRIKDRLRNGERICEIARDLQVPYYDIENIKRGNSRRYA
jgi:hypothetical protein